MASTRGGRPDHSSSAVLRLRHAAVRRAQPPPAGRPYRGRVTRRTHRRAALPRHEPPVRVPLRRSRSGRYGGGARRSRGRLRRAVRGRAARTRPAGGFLRRPYRQPLRKGGRAGSGGKLADRRLGLFRRRPHSSGPAGFGCARAVRGLAAACRAMTGGNAAGPARGISAGPPGIARKPSQPFPGVVRSAIRPVSRIHMAVQCPRRRIAL